MIWTILFSVLALAGCGYIVFTFVRDVRRARAERSSRASDKAGSDRTINSENSGNDR